MQYLKRIIMTKYLAVSLLIISANVAFADKISDLRLCASRGCDVLISQARALARHKPTDPIMLSFDRGDLINIYSKSAGKRVDLWGGEINGKRGYFPRSFVRELKVEIPNPQFTVETESYVPLEDRIMGRVPDSPKSPEADTEKQHEDPKEQQQDTQNNQENLDKNPAVQEVTKQNDEPAVEASSTDETEIDETELPELPQLPVEEPESEQKEKDSRIKTEDGGKEAHDKPSADETEIAEDKQLADETDLLTEKSPDREELTEKLVEPTDETEINEEDDNKEKDETETEDKSHGLSENQGSDEKHKLPEKPDAVKSEDPVVSENVNQQKQHFEAEKGEKVLETTQKDEKQGVDAVATENKIAGEEVRTKEEKKEPHADDGDETELPDDVDETDIEPNKKEHVESDVKVEASVQDGDTKIDGEKEEETKKEIKNDKADETGGSFFGNMLSEDTEGKHSHTVAVANNGTQMSSSSIDNTLSETVDDKPIDHVGKHDIVAGGNNVGDTSGAGFKKSDVDIEIKEEKAEKINDETYSTNEPSVDMHGNDTYKEGGGLNLDTLNTDKPSADRVNKVSDDIISKSEHEDIEIKLKDQDDPKMVQKLLHGKNNVPDKEKSVADHHPGESAESENLDTGKKRDTGNLEAFREKHMDKIGGEHVLLNYSSSHLETSKVQGNTDDSMDKVKTDIVKTSDETQLNRANSKINEDVSGHVQVVDGAEDIHPKGVGEAVSGKVNIKDGAHSDGFSSSPVSVGNDLSHNDFETLQTDGLHDGTNSEDDQMTETKSFDAVFGSSSKEDTAKAADNEKKNVDLPMEKKDDMLTDNNADTNKQESVKEAKETVNLPSEVNVEGLKKDIAVEVSKENEKKIADNLDEREKADVNEKPDTDALKFINDKGEIDDEEVEVKKSEVDEIKKKIVIEMEKEKVENVDKTTNLDGDAKSEEGSSSFHKTANLDGAAKSEEGSSSFQASIIPSTSTQMPAVQVVASASNKGTIVDGTFFPDEYLGGEETTQTSIVGDSTRLYTNTYNIDGTMFTTVEETLLTSNTELFKKVDDTQKPVDIISPTAAQQATSAAKSDITSYSEELKTTTHSTESLDNKVTQAIGLSQVKPPTTAVIHENIQSSSSTDFVASSSTSFATQFLETTLETSFDHGKQSSDTTYSASLDAIHNLLETSLNKFNETVRSNNVQEQVQPSQNLDAYTTNAFLSRKPLSSGATDSAEASAEADPKPTDEKEHRHSDNHVHTTDSYEQEIRPKQDQTVETHAHSHGQHGHSHGQSGHGHSHGQSGHGHSHGQSGHGHSHGQSGHGHSHGQKGHGQSGHGHSHGQNGHGHSHGQNGHGHSHGQNSHGQIKEMGHFETIQNLDENNNEKTTQPTPEDYYERAPPTDIPPQGQVMGSEAQPLEDLYSADHVFGRKVPDSNLDEEETKRSSMDILKALDPIMKTLIDMMPGSVQGVLEQEPLGMSPTLTMLVSLVSTAVLGLATCLGCLCKGEKKKSGKKDPVVIIRALEEKLFISTKEKENLEDDLQIKVKKIEELQREVTTQQASSGTAETEVGTVKLHNDSLKKQVSALHQEVTQYKQEVADKEEELTRLREEVSAYETDVRDLEQRATDAEKALQKTVHQLHERKEELTSAHTRLESLAEQVKQLETRKQQLEDESADWAEKVKDLTEQVQLSAEESSRIQEDLAYKASELEVLRDCFLQVKAFQGEEEQEAADETPLDLNEKLKQMMDVSRVNATLRAVEDERDVLQNKLAIEIDSRKELEDQIQGLKRHLETGQTDKMKAERQCQEAQTRLEVLSKYFREKEAELTRQLGEQEVLKNQNMSKLQNTSSMTEELSKQNEIYRQQIEDLKSEISKAERDFRSQIAANEKKAHENWLATRAAERELKESKHECGMLRHKLTELERKLLQAPPPGLIRPITHRGMPPPGLLNGPPPPPPERPGSRGSVHGHVTPRLRDDYRESPGPDRIPPPPGAMRLPPGVRPPPPPHHSATSPPPFAVRHPFPGDRRSPPPFDRFPPPPPHMRGPRPPFPRPPPPHLRSPPVPIGSSSEMDDSRDSSRMDRVSPSFSRGPPPPASRDRGQTRHASQV
ncbi:transport and Golgi organization protein 1 homolog isoform X2 [Dreissena polymorpha]|uniref:transport and Golgi organization protein 1 homolog isoform X2 n=1 Tax=Dreissena polymorpha TaxID=45954 RepID=UPI00226473C6|nr:transport and Golgi organization protein 1 homolog isoform X2 [Dreissena polymorpha]